MPAVLLLVSYVGWFVLLMGLLLLPGVLLSHLAGRVSSLKVPGVIVRMAFGAAFWIVVVFCLSATKQLGLESVGGIAAGLLLLALPLIPAAWRRLRTAPISAVLKMRVAPGDGILALSLIAVLAVLFLQALSPEVATDAQVYHLHVPKVTIENGGFTHIPFNVYSHWPMNIQMLFTLALLLKDQVLASLVHYLFGALIVLGLILFGREWQATRAGFFAAALFLANGAVLFEMPIAYVDVGSAFFLFAAFWCVSLALGSEEKRFAHLVAAGLLCGVLAGTKLNAVIGGAALAAVYVVARSRQSGVGPALREAILCLGLPTLVLAVPWYVKSAVETGNPVYPLLYDYLGGIEWNESLSRQFNDWHLGIGMGRAPMDYLRLPFRVFLQSGLDYDHFGARLNPAWIVLIPLSLLAGRRRPVVTWSLFAGLIYFALWSLSSQQTRFLIPALPLLAAAAGMALVDLLDRLGRWRRVAEPVLIAALVAGLAYTTVRTARDYRWRGPQLDAAARERAVPPVFRRLNAELKPSARVLFVSVNRAFFSRSEVIADSFFEASQVNELLMVGRTSEEIVAELHARGITHILRWYHNRDIPYPREFRRLFRDPQTMSLVFEVDRFELFELLPPGATARQ